MFFDTTAERSGGPGGFEHRQPFTINKPRGHAKRYYRQQASALLAWARATTDKAWASLLRERAAKQLEQAAEADTITDLNPLLADFNEQQMRKTET